MLHQEVPVDNYVLDTNELWNGAETTINENVESSIESWAVQSMALPHASINTSAQYTSKQDNLLCYGMVSCHLS
jgi:c-di-AMP phosphodiesterase-like protein